MSRTKRSVALVLTLVMLLCTGVLNTSAALPEGVVIANDSTDTIDGEIYGVIGDTDQNAIVNVKDVTQIQKYAAKLVELAEKSLNLADVNFDGIVSVKDATAIQKKLAKYPSDLSINKVSYIPATEAPSVPEEPVATLATTASQALTEADTTRLPTTALQTSSTMATASEETTTAATDITETTDPTEPAVDKLAPILIVEETDDGYFLAVAYAADGAENVQYQFDIDGVVYQNYSEDSTFKFGVDTDKDILCYIEVTAKYEDGLLRSTRLTFEVKDGAIILPEMPERPTKPIFVPDDETTEPIESSTEIEATEATNATEATEATKAPVTEVTEATETTVTEATESIEDNTSSDDDGMITIYFHNVQNWHEVDIYYWLETTGEDPVYTWPGEPMEYVGTTEYGVDVYMYEVYSEVGGIIFNDGIGYNQTEEVTEGIVDNVCFYTLEQNGDDQWVIESIYY